MQLNKFWIAIAIVIAGCSGPIHEGGVKPPAQKPFGNLHTMSPETYLRKLSLHIRGLTPSRAEYRQLAMAVLVGREKAFLSDITQTYLASDEHVDKMTFRLEELFLFQPSAVNNFSPLRGLGLPINKYSLDNSLNDLFREVSSRNLSWDTLLTGRSYKAHPLKNSNGFVTSDLLFYSSTSGTAPRGTEAVDVRFEEDDNRVAGSLTTSRFFNRYANTALNKNRRRAAAVFRIFMCDDMKAVVVDEKGNQDGILDRVFPGGGGGGRPGDPQAGEKRHGSDQACMKCHEKLDPLGLGFQSSGMILSPFASPGGLFFKRADGTVVNHPASGLGEIAKVITEQPEYARCQVQHFWRWFVGQDRFLEESTLNELTAKFEEVKRRPNDFIAYLVTRPEFSSNKMSTALGQTVFQVKSTLQNCNGCHAVEGVPSFTNWPIGGTQQSHQKWLRKISSALALNGSGKPRWMPPARSLWQPDADQISVLQKWFDQGSPDEEEVQ